MGWSGPNDNCNTTHTKVHSISAMSFIDGFRRWNGGDVGTEIICELLPVSVESGEFWFLVMVKLVEIEWITQEFQSVSTFSFL
ncbi:hypothetical protein YC2023_078130 [Brassica napus]